MEVPNNLPISPFPGSARAEWEILKKTYNPEKLFLKCASYEAIGKLSKIMAEHWHKWEPQVQNVLEKHGIDSNGATSFTFLKHLCSEGLECRVEYLSDLAKKVNDEHFKKILLDVNEKHIAFNEYREIVDADMSSNGLLRDLSEGTLQELAKLMEVNPKWKKIADGLGFKLQDCLNFNTPIEMLKEVISVYPKLPLSRVFYEAIRLNMTTVGAFIENIPLQKEAKIEILPVPKEDNTYLTLFDMRRLEQLYTEADLHIEWPVEKNLKENCLWKNFLKRNQIKLLQGSVSDGEIDEAANCLKTFNEENRSGAFEPTSKGGIRYSQIVYLAACLNEEVTLLKSETKGPLDFLSLFQSTMLYNGHGFKKVLKWDAEKFLLSFWQLNEEMDLDEYCHSIIKILEKVSQEAAVSFRERFLSIKPQRYHNHDNIADKVNQESKEILKKSTEKKTCVICYEGKVTTSAIPCGHLAYCQECIEKINQCSICDVLIQSRVRIYKGHA